MVGFETPTLLANTLIDIGYNDSIFSYNTAAHKLRV